jgi:hypothetical protein
MTNKSLTHSIKFMSNSELRRLYHSVESYVETGTTAETSTLRVFTLTMLGTATALQMLDVAHIVWREVAYRSGSFWIGEENFHVTR